MTKNIKDYLHLYIGHLAEISQLSQRMVAYGFEDGQVKINGYFIDALEKESSFVIKPILRPLSDMTEEDKTILFRLAFGAEHEYTSFGFSPVEQILLADKDKSTRCAVSLTSIPAEGVRYLLSRGFDLFGLIEAGLAIDKTKLPTP